MSYRFQLYEGTQNLSFKNTVGCTPPVENKHKEQSSHKNKRIHIQIEGNWMKESGLVIEIEYEIV